MNQRELEMSVAAAALASRERFAGDAAITPPVTEIRPRRIEQLGRVRIDNYAWLRDPNWAEVFLDPSHMQPDIRAHLDTENRYAEKILAPAEPRRALFEARIAELAIGEAGPPHKQDGDWTYYTRLLPGGVGLVHARRRGDGSEEILLDEGTRAKGHAYFRVLNAQHSPDHSLYVWSEDIEGGDRYRIVVHDLKSGSIIEPTDANLFGWFGLVVSPDSAWLFWIWRDDLGRPTRIMRRPSRGGPDVEVYAEADPALFLSLGRTASGRFLTIRVSGPDVDEWHLVPGENTATAPILVEPRQPGLHYQVTDWDDQLVILTDLDGALDGRLMTTDVARPGQAHWRDWIAHEPGRQILEMHAFSNHFVRLQRIDCRQEIVISVRGDQPDRKVSFDDPAYAVSIPHGQPYDATVLHYGYETPASPVRWMTVGLANGSQSIVRQQSLGQYDADAYEVRRLWAPAPDGETVPVTVLMRRGARLDGASSMMLHGYGAYGVSTEAEFSPAMIALVDAGWTVAIAHVRGGSEKGRGWFLGGRRFAKKTSFTDFNAVADFLIAEGYARARRIVAYGFSAGGLLVGGALNLRPDLWAGVIVPVPFVDMLNTMSDHDHPLVPAFRPDWGDPLSDTAAYDYIASISPYENVGDQAYPMALATAGIRDNRVSYWEPAKWVANLRARSTSGAPIVFHVDMAAGHQVSGSAAEGARLMALLWSFAELCLEDAEQRWSGS